jgi:hypothetical protein
LAPSVEKVKSHWTALEAWKDRWDCLFHLLSQNSELRSSKKWKDGRSFVPLPYCHLPEDLRELT